MNDHEREAIVLRSAWEMIDNMVNWAMFAKTDAQSPTTLFFQTSQHAQLFVILLGDFLSEVRAFKGSPIPFGLRSAPSGARPTDLTFLFHLREVCRHPRLGSDPAELENVIEAFAAWLEVQIVATGVNLGDIDLVADISVSRLRYLKMCGDIAKHNLARLETNVRHLRRLLAASGHEVEEHEAYRAIAGFYEWFQNNIFLRHATQIAEALNNIRWAIYAYLQPEFRRSFSWDDRATQRFPLYHFDVPHEIGQPVAHAMYWDLMNLSRSPPYVQRFVIPAHARKEY